MGCAGSKPPEEAPVSAPTVTRHDDLRATSFDRMARSPAFVNVHPGSSKGGYGLGRAQLTAAAAAALDTRWREVVAPETGAASYEELYEQVNGRPFPIPLPRLLQHANI